MSSLINKKSNFMLNSNHLTNNLRYLMQKSGIDAAELSKSTGIALTTINGLKRGAGNPTLSTLQTISDFFNITIGQLTENILSDNHGKNNLVEVPLLEIQEINDLLFNFDNVKTKIAVEVEKSNSLFAIKLSNNSLAPFFEKGTIFIICPEFRPQDGDIVLVQFNDQLPCFRKIFIEGEAYIFSPVSEMLGSEISKSKNFIIHGVVTKAIQNFHE
ncbi:helix-turn-helix domain-containing protein [Legionella fairfieldensis]|uniref:helix-turn-helix domain-containing protein n=1 Tax=Legionella fairfieldensis TaxID=45064 RepID=UPI0004912D03|nr:helix-turn-helix domain-containing protein [Legionella fairfieldensis]